MTQLTTATLPLPDPGVQRTCTASTACPTVVLGHDPDHADGLIADHHDRVHGIPARTATT
ncbi:hypothetical protein [Streptacidiphilus sp. PAMC 29251]